MHQILLRRVTFSNLLSYGNSKHEVRFDDCGLIWVRGGNGAGKSTVIEALTFAFFGSSYRKGEHGNLPLKELLNTANKTGKLVVEVEFERIDSNSHKVYQINRQLTRSGNSSFSYRSKDFGAVEFGTENKGAGTTQKKIEGEILGFNKNIFENVISLNTIQRDPIIEMRPVDKRKLIESILTLSIDKFKELNGKTLKQAQTKFDAATSDVEKYIKDVSELQGIISQMEQERADSIKELEEELARMNLDIETHRKTQNDAQIELSKIIDVGKLKKAESDSLGNVNAKIDALGDIKVLIPQLNNDEEKLVTAKSKLESIRSTYAEMSNAVDALEGSKLTDRLSIVKSKLSEHNASLSTKTIFAKAKKDSMDKIQIKATELKSGVPCGTCGKPSTEDDINTIKKSYRSEWLSLNNEYKILLSEIESHTKDKSVLELEQTQIESQIELNTIEYNKLCEYQSLTVQPAEFAVSSIESDIQNKRDKISTYNIISVDEVDVQLKKLEIDKITKDALTLELNELRNQVSTLTERLNGVKNTIDTLITKRDTLESKIETKKLNISKDSLTATKDKLIGANHDLETARNRVDKYSDKIAINQYIAGMYADNGIKKLVLGIFMPNLNKAMAHNLRRFNLPYTLKFTDSMDLEFSSRFGMADSYYGLSEGQKRKINFAVALSLRDFVTSIADFKMNVLFLDEVLDISTDPEAYVDMVTLLKDNIKTIGTVYMITHRGELVTEYFDKCLEFTNDGRYSSIREVDLTLKD